MSPPKATIKTKKKTRLVLPIVKTLRARSIKDHISLFYGPPGIGKTTFAEGLSDTTFFISTDRGADYIPTLALPAYNWAEFLEVVIALEQQDAASKYDIVCIDHTDDFTLMAENFTCKALGIEALDEAGWSKGYKTYKRNIWTVLQRILKLGVGLVLITHEKLKPIKGPIKKDLLLPELTNSASKVILPKCDIVGYCSFAKSKTKTGEIRVVRTQPTSFIYAKDRTNRIKPTNGIELLDGEKFRETFKSINISAKGVKYAKVKRPQPGVPN